MIGSHTVYRIKKGYPYPRSFVKVFSNQSCAYVITDHPATYEDIARCELQFVADRLFLSEALEKVESLVWGDHI